MNKDDWQKVKQILDDALAVPSAERSNYLDREVGIDSDIRSEVEKLLTAYESGFLEDSAMPLAAEALADSGLTTGQVIGRYKIAELVGTGGMGEVFRADDTELDRSVAFKVLHRDVADDEERVRRFIQEAKAASALNHPNIITIHEIGSFEGSRYIVSEYVDGATLRDKMHDGLNVAESVDITCQIAAALQAAHSAGIVHRDIKPENVMIRKDDLVKVLDFGLAKLTEADDQPIDASAPLSRVHTSPGLVMGTVAYMSPEQAKGQPVDARTDLWSLGVVLHEMLTGSSPFEGESVTDLVSSIIKKDTPPAHLETLPSELRPICQKALAKDKDSRYRSAHDLLKDLEGEKKRMEYAIQPTPYITSSSTDDLKTQLIRRRPTLSAEYIVTSVKRHKYATVAAVLVIAAAAVGLSVFKYNGATPPSKGGDLSAIGLSTTEADLKLARFPSTGNLEQIAISPDGNFIVYVTRDGPDKNGIRLRQTESLSTDRELLPATATGTFKDLSFSPDSRYVYYRHGFPASIPDTIERVSVTGGVATKIVVDAESGASISPDGKMLAFSREIEHTPSGGGDEVIVANTDGTNEKVLVHSPYAGPAWVDCGPVPAWAPDGKALACMKYSDSPEGRFVQITMVNPIDGTQQTRDEKWWEISGAVFMPDSSLVIAGRPMSSEKLAPSQLWLIPSSGPPKSITSDVAGYSTLSATQKGDVLVTMHTKSPKDLWAIRGNDMATARQITNSGELYGGGGFNWTPDGRILFISDVSGNADVWIMNADGGGRKQLTRNHGINIRAQMSPDGRFIAFMSSGNGWDSHIFRMDADGANLKQLTSSAFSERFPHFSPDGKWVYYIQVFPDNTPSRLCKTSIEGGEPIVLAVGARSVLDVSSRDGSIAYLPDQAPGTQGIQSVKIMSPSDPSDIKTVAKPADLVLGGLIKWSPDGRSLMVTNGKNPAFYTLQSVSLAGKLSKPILTFPSAVGDVGWSKDGKQLGFIHATTTTEGVLIMRKED